MATDTDYVQGRLAAYLKDLLSLGVTGLRMDAAKHIASSDIANIFSRVGPIPYVTQEESYMHLGTWNLPDNLQVIYGDNEAVQPSEYVQNGAVQELVLQRLKNPSPNYFHRFRYTQALQTAFSGDGIIWLQDFENRGGPF